MATDLERIEPEALIARPVISADEAVDAAKELRQMIARVLVKNKHWQTIRGKDVLLKAGAEELQRVFGLNFEYTELSTSRDDGVFEATVKCSVRNSMGTNLADSYGMFDQTEMKGSKPNTVVKMAQKRAYVGAIMSATGTSELFTQDIEDELAQVKADPSPPSTADQRLLLSELFARKRPCSLVESEAWVRTQPHCLEERWVTKQITTLLLKPDPKKTDENLLSAQPPENVELEPDPPLEGEVVAEENPDDEIPF